MDNTGDKPKTNKLIGKKKRRTVISKNDPWNTESPEKNISKINSYK